jgi:hypothetical protein
LVSAEMKVGAVLIARPESLERMQPGDASFDERQARAA